MNDIKELNRIRRAFLKYVFTVMQNIPHGTVPNIGLLTQVVKERFETEHTTTIVRLQHAGIRGEVEGCIILQDKKRVVLDYDLSHTGYPSYKDDIRERADIERRSQMNCIAYVEFRNGTPHGVRTLTPDAFNGKWHQGDGWRCIDYSFAPPCLRYDSNRDAGVEALQRMVEEGWYKYDELSDFSKKLNGKQTPNVLRCIYYRNEHPSDIDVAGFKHRELFPAHVVLKYNWDTMHYKDFATLQHLDQLPERKVVRAPGTYFVNGNLTSYIAQNYEHAPRKLKEFEHMMQNYRNIENEW